MTAKLWGFSRHVVFHDRQNERGFVTTEQGTDEIYRKTSNIRRTLGGNKIVDHSDVVGASPVGDSRLDIWLQGIQQRKPQDSTRIFEVSGFGASYIRDLTVCAFGKTTHLQYMWL